MSSSIPLLRWKGPDHNGVERHEVLDVHADGTVVLEIVEGVLPGDPVGRFGHRADAELADLRALATALLDAPSDLDVPRHHRWLIVHSDARERTLGVPLGEAPGHPDVVAAEQWRQRLRGEALATPVAAVRGRWRAARPLPGAERRSLVIELASVGTDPVRLQLDPTGVTSHDGRAPVFESSGIPTSGGLVAAAELHGDGFREAAVIPAGTTAAATFGDVLPDNDTGLTVRIEGMITVAPRRTERFRLIASPPPGT